MIKRILVEGPDCSGKSTAIDRIKNALKWDAKSLHHREGDQFNRYIKEYCSADNTVFDRGHFSEAVYGQMWRGGNPFSEEEFTILNRYSQKEGLIIFAIPSEKTLIERYTTRDFLQQIKKNELPLARKLFVEQAQKVSHFSYASSSYQELDSLVDNILWRVKNG